MNITKSNNNSEVFLNHIGTNKNKFKRFIYKYS